MKVKIGDIIYSETFGMIVIVLQKKEIDKFYWVNLCVIKSLSKWVHDGNFVGLWQHEFIRKFDKILK